MTQQTERIKVIHADDDFVSDSIVADEIGGEDVLEEAAQNIRRGARRASNAVRDAVSEGADAIDDALRPSLAEQLSQLSTALREDPAEALEVARDIVRDRPITSLAAIAVAAIALHKTWRLIAR